MKYRDSSTQNRLLFSLAIASVVFVSLSLFMNLFGGPSIWFIFFIITAILDIVATILFLLCTRSNTANHLKPKLYITGFTLLCVTRAIDLLSYVLLIFMGSYVAIARVFMHTPYIITLIIITVFLFIKKYRPWLFTAFCIGAGVGFASDLLIRFSVSEPTLSGILWSLFYVLCATLPIIFIAITLRTGCFFPPEMRLQQLMSMRTTGKLDEVSYQEQRAEVIENL